MAELSSQQIEKYLRQANEIAKRAMQFGKHPFGALLLAPDNETVLLEQGNVDHVNHAESLLARLAYMNFNQEYLWKCTLITSVEPCCMCTGTIYWANIGRVIFGISERELFAITGDHKENPTLDVSCKYIVEHGQKAIEVMGPIAAVREEISEVHRKFWK